MEICDFEYHRPTTLAEACRLGAELGPEVRYLAGGTELLADLKQQRDATPHVVSLSGIPELGAIRDLGGGLHLGATAKLQDILESPVVRQRFPGLAHAISQMAARQIRQRASIGGNFCGGVPSADTPPICIAAGATVAITGPDGERTLPAEDFFQGVRQTALKPGEVLTAVVIPALPAGSAARYARFQLRQATALAVAGVAAWVRREGDQVAEAKVVLGALAPVPRVAAQTSAWLAGQPATEATWEAAGERAAAEARPISDLRGSAEHRRSLANSLTVRALRAALAHAAR